MHCNKNNIVNRFGDTRFVTEMLQIMMDNPRQFPTKFHPLFTQFQVAVTAVLHAYDESDFHLIRKSLKPTVIPSPQNLRDAFSKGWDIACGVPFVFWCTMLLAGWCTYLWGCRPNCDMNSLKTSAVHCDNEPQGAGLKPEA